jgi:hypothetical protein
MKVLSLVSLLAAAAALSGCSVSLQPFYTTATLLDDRSIEGRWTDGETTWQVTRTTPATFEIAACEEQTCKVETVGVLFREDGVTFLDFQEKSESRFTSAIRPHGLFQVRMRGDAIDLVMLDGERLAKLAEQQHLDTDFADLESGVLLTATPQNLQKFVVSHLSDPQVFGEVHQLRRPGQAD